MIKILSSSGINTINVNTELLKSLGCLGVFEARLGDDL